MEYRELYEWGVCQLCGAGIAESSLDARLLLEEVCGTDRNDLLVHADREVAAGQRDRYTDFILQRKSRIPLQQIVGYQEFMGLRFAVNGDVLIPRQDTEILVEEALRQLHDGMRILDLCTGSGCILLSLLHYSNDCIGVGSDISPRRWRRRRRMRRPFPWRHPLYRGIYLRRLRENLILLCPIRPTFRQG